MTEPYQPKTTPAPPDMGLSGVATVVVGRTMGPIVDGSMVYYNHEESLPTADLFGKLCVCAVPLGTRYVRVLQPGSKPGLYDLHSVTGETLKDQALHWAQPVIWIRLPS